MPHFRDGLLPLVSWQRADDGGHQVVRRRTDVAHVLHHERGDLRAVILVLLRDCHSCRPSRTARATRDLQCIDREDRGDRD
eukprot:9546126-Prorocentrum_lima.AAC.1